MDSYEATRVVFSRIQNLDPENASKIMGLLLIQDHGEKEMIRLAFGPESLVHSVILKARKELDFLSNTPSTPSSPSSPSPFSRQNSSSSSASSRFLNGTSNRPSPLSVPNPSFSGASSLNFPDYQNTEDLISPSTYSSNNTAPFARSAPSSNGMSNLRFGSSPSTRNSLTPAFYRNGVAAGENDLINEFHLQEQLSFLNDGLSPPFVPESPDFFSPGQPDLAFRPYMGSLGPHRRTCSMNDICLGEGAGDVGDGFGWKPCLYFARGYCKNGTSCRFVHGDDGAVMAGSLDTNKLEMMKQCQELLRSKAAHQQRLAAASQLMGSPNFPYSPKNCMNFLLEQQQNDSPRAAAAAALMMGEEMNKFGRNRLERNEFLMNGGMEMMNPSSRQIYLTFPADSTFKEEDVSNYFSIFGPVQDVRIPYQQKRMFGFVTFVYPDTVKLIHAKGNPHFVCDARVLVKPYKEKGKVLDKFRKQLQQMETGEYSSCGSPTGFDSRDPFDLQLGPRMLYNTQDLLWRRKLEEQADLQQAIELQNRRLMGLQLLDVKRSHHQRALSTGAAIPSPTHSPSFLNHSSFFHSHYDRSSPEEDDFMSRLGAPVIVSVDDHHNVNGYEKEREKEKESSDCLSDENGNGKSSPHHEEIDFSESLEHNLPDSLFASPKAAGVYRTAFSTDAADYADKNVPSLVSLGTNNLITAPLLPATSTFDMASLKSCYFQVPRFASGHGGHWNVGRWPTSGAL